MSAKADDLPDGAEKRTAGSGRCGGTGSKGMGSATAFIKCRRSVMILAHVVHECEQTFSMTDSAGIIKTVYTYSFYENSRSHLPSQFSAALLLSAELRDGPRMARRALRRSLERRRARLPARVPPATAGVAGA